MKVASLVLAIGLISIQATCQTSHSADLSWGASSTAGVTYNVYRADGKLCSQNPAFVKVGNTASLTFHDANLPAKTSFAYVIKATDGVDESVPSNCADGTTLKDPIGPAGSLTIIFK